MALCGWSPSPDRQIVTESFTEIHWNSTRATRVRISTTDFFWRGSGGLLFILCKFAACHNLSKNSLIEMAVSDFKRSTFRPLNEVNRLFGKEEGRRSERRKARDEEAGREGGWGEKSQAE